MPLLSQYDLAIGFTKEELIFRAPTLWRYQELLPVFEPKNQVTLGEGFTPILKLNRLASAHSIQNLFLKDEGQNPTGSFKARGLCMAISKAKELGKSACIIPTAGRSLKTL